VWYLNLGGFIFSKFVSVTNAFKYGESHARSAYFDDVFNLNH